jgi:tetratricopeptide (TPR) repeat protein
MVFSSLKYVLAGWLAGLSMVQVVWAQSDVLAARTRVYEAYVTHNQPAWEAGISQLQQLYAQRQEPAVLYELCLAQYGLAAWCAGQKCPDVDKRIQEVQKNLDKLIQLQPRHAAAHAMMGAAIAMEMGRTPAKAIYLGPRSTYYLDKALSLDPNNAAAWVEKGNMRYHAPGVFGGDKAEAVKCFQKAVTLFEANASLRQSNWLYLHALTWLGRSCEAVGDRNQALATYRRIVALEPRFEWVRLELLPQLEMAR